MHPDLPFWRQALAPFVDLPAFRTRGRTPDLSADNDKLMTDPV